MSPEQELSALAAKFGVPVTGERAITLHPPFGADGAGDEGQTFDCVIAGGNISWWEESERQYLWDFLKSGLADRGVAFLHVDSYPGARCLDLIRDIARIHCIDVNPETVPDLLGILSFLAGEGQHPAYRMMVRAQLEQFHALDPALVARRLTFDRRVYALAELEELAVSLGLQCARLEPTFGGQQGVAFRRLREEPRGGGPTASTIGEPEHSDLPYPEYLHRRTSPESIASMGYAFGLNSPDPRRCRMLELGCGTGLSLLTFASAHPEASFFGLDLSEGSIAAARAAAEAAGIRNVRFEAMDILDFGRGGESVGEFDYIVAHGVYSWTPEPVRKQVLRICDQYLSPDGVAFVSFNARPGYHINLMLRDAGLWFARNATNLRERSQKAIEGLRTMDFSAFPLPGVSELVATRFREIEKANPIQSGFDEFGDINSPVLFSTFIQEIRANRLRYVTEAEIIDWTSRVLPQTAQGLLSQLEGDPLRRMDYRDLARCNSFHAALVVKQNGQQPAPVPISSRLENMLVSAGAFPASPSPDVRGATEERFETSKGSYVEISDPCMKAFLVALCDAAPLRLPAGEAMRRAADLAGVDPQAAARKILDWFQMFWESEFIQLHLTPSPAAASYGERPSVFPVARLHGARTGKAPTLIGGLIAVEDERERRLLQLADGARTVAELARDAGVEIAEAERILARWARQGLFAASGA